MFYFLLNKVFSFLFSNRIFFTIYHLGIFVFLFIVYIYTVIRMASKKIIYLYQNKYKLIKYFVWVQQFNSNTKNNVSLNIFYYYFISFP